MEKGKAPPDEADPKVVEEEEEEAPPAPPGIELDTLDEAARERAGLWAGNTALREISSDNGESVDAFFGLREPGLDK